MVKKWRIEDLSDVPPLEIYEKKVKDGKVLKIFTLNKLLTRLPILLRQIKSGKNPYKLKNDIRKILHLYQHDKIIKKVYNNLIKSLWSWKTIWL